MRVFPYKQRSNKSKSKEQIFKIEVTYIEKGHLNTYFNENNYHENNIFLTIFYFQS